MSNVYNLEPPVSGKVIVKTTYGDIEFSLFAKESPKACRNFVQLCLEGYYDNTIFHRVIKDFIIQGGDPTGTGEGGDSIYGGLFKDEFHSRLRFAHRGMIACASKDNQRDSNNSQFFITLDKADFLDRKHTIFGKIEGDTLYNVLKIGDVDVDESDRPIDPPRILSTEVLWNPYDDIVPRTTREERLRAEQERREAAERAERQARKGKINAALLSFGGEEEEEEDTDLPKIKFKPKNAYDVLVGGPIPEDQLRPLSNPASNPSAPSAPAPRKADLMKDRIREQMAQAGAPKAPKPAAAEPPRPREGTEGEALLDYGEGDSDEEDTRPAKAARREEDTTTADKYTRGSRPVFDKAVKDAALLTHSQVMQKQYRSRKQQGGSREKETLAKLAKFTSKIGGPAASGSEAQKEKASEAAQGGGYDGQVDAQLDLLYQPAAWRVDSYLDAPEDEDEKGGLAALRRHKLSFAKDPRAKAGPDSLDDYIVVDPLLQEGKDKFNQQQQKLKKKALAWAGGSRN